MEEEYARCQKEMEAEVREAKEELARAKGDCKEKYSKLESAIDEELELSLPSPPEKDVKPEEEEKTVEESPKHEFGKDMWKQLTRVSIPVFSGDKRSYGSWKVVLILLFRVIALRARSRAGKLSFLVNANYVISQKIPTLDSIIHPYWRPNIPVHSLGPYRNLSRFPHVRGLLFSTACRSLTSEYNTINDVKSSTTFSWASSSFFLEALISRLLANPSSNRSAS